MKIINKTKGTLLADKVTVANSSLRRLIGLLNRRQLKEGEALIIKPCNSIHTFFMRFPIDVIFVDSQNKVIAVKNCFNPWRISAVYWRAKFVIELPCGTLLNSSTTKGDDLLLT